MISVSVVELPGLRINIRLGKEITRRESGDNFCVVRVILLVLSARLMAGAGVNQFRGADDISMLIVGRDVGVMQKRSLGRYLVDGAVGGGTLQTLRTSLREGEIRSHHR